MWRRVKVVSDGGESKIIISGQELWLGIDHRIS